MRASNIFLIIAVVALGWVFLRGGEDKFAGQAAIDYDRLAVSQGLTEQAVGLNLAADLDVSLLPELGKQVIREAAQKGLKEQAFLQEVIVEMSNRVREISTIDLNADDVVDPILIKPEPQEGEQYVLLSIRVPAPDAYPLPEAKDGAAWKEVETIEVATMSVAFDQKTLTVQAQGNQHAYPGSAGQHYSVHDRAPSFLQMYMTMRMMEWMFFPRYYGFWGPGYGYGMYRPMGVPMMTSRRAGAISNRNYQRAPGTASSSIRTRGGGAPTSQYSRAFSKNPPRSLNQLKSSTAFQRRQASKLRAGGFGRTSGQRTVGRAGSSFSQRRAGVASRSIRRKSSFGGFGRRRGFGGFGRGGFRMRR